MKEIEHKLLKVVYGRTPSEFEHNYNRTMEDLSGFDIDVHMDLNRKTGYCAFVTYTQYEKIPESLSDELNIRGLSVTCSDCPFLERTSDCRRKWFPCAFSSLGRTSLSSPACNHFYECLIQMFKVYSMGKKNNTVSLPILNEIPGLDSIRDEV